MLTLMLPLVPLDEAEPCPEQLTEAEVAPLVLQEKFGTLPGAVDVVGDHTVLVTDGAETAVRFEVDGVPATPTALYGVTVQEPGPVPDTLTLP